MAQLKKPKADFQSFPQFFESYYLLNLNEDESLTILDLIGHFLWCDMAQKTQFIVG